MNKKIKFVISSNLSVESIDYLSGTRIIINTITGHRLALNTESLKILELFTCPTTLVKAIKDVNVINKRDVAKFKSHIKLLSEHFFIVDTSRIEEESITSSSDISDLLRIPITVFANCPGVKLDEVESGSIVICGLSCDSATTGQPGTRYGPKSFRESSVRFVNYERDIFSLKSKGIYNSDVGKTILKNVNLFDIGDIHNSPDEDMASFHQHCYELSQAIYEKDSLPLFIGGDHSISAPLIRACNEKYKDITVIHIDAHTDLASWGLGEPHHHGNVMSRVMTENENIKLYQFGIRGFSGNWTNAKPNHLVVEAREIESNIDKVISNKIPKKNKCYISLDVDVLDPCFAPGTGTPVPMGISPRQLLQLLIAITKHNQIVGIDLVELCPVLDKEKITADTAFHIITCLLDLAYN